MGTDLGGKPNSEARKLSPLKSLRGLEAFGAVHPLKLPFLGAHPFVQVGVVIDHPAADARESRALALRAQALERAGRDAAAIGRLFGRHVPARLRRQRRLDGVEPVFDSEFHAPNLENHRGRVIHRF